MRKQEKRLRSKNELQSNGSVDFSTDKHLHDLRESLVSARENIKITQTNKLSFRLLLPLLISTVLILLLLVILKPYIIGLVSYEVSYEKELYFNDTINLDFTSSSEYEWKVNNLGNIQSIKLFGQLQNNTKARVYIENEGIKYLIFDTDMINLTPSLQKITALATKEDKDKDDKNKTENKDKDEKIPISETINITIPINETINATPIINETIQNETFYNQTINLTQPIINGTINISQNISQPVNNKSITIKLEYNKDTPYDEDNDGSELLTNAIDFTVENSHFNWNVDKSKLCTRWEIYSIDAYKSTTACYGNNECCALINLQPSRSDWNEPFYLAYNSFGATYNNIVSAQIVYANYSLEGIDIVSSSWSNLSAVFKEEGLLSFEGVCIETCVLFNFNKSSYNLIVEVDNGKIILNNINYAVSQLKESIAPQLIKNISNYVINKGRNITINLGEHFKNVDDNTIFTYFKIDNITIVFENNIAVILLDKDFVGIGFTFITANKSDSLVTSNLFSITVTNITTNVTPNLILRKRDFMLDEDIDGDFEYLTKQELIKETKWKDEYEIYEEKPEKRETESNLLKEKIEQEQKFSTQAETSAKKQKKKFVKANDTIEPLIYDDKGDLTPIEPEIEELREGKFKIKLPRQRAFRAGKYTLKLELVKDGVTYTQQQDFTWGVLAININKSIYLPNDDSFIGIAVLDDSGKVVCNADLTLTIKNPLNETTTLTTSNNEIKISSECDVLGITELPDYYATYSVGGVGTYLMNLTAVTQNGVRSVQDNFTVQSNVAFDVARKGPTRVYPIVPYRINFTVNANDDYSGPIIEYVPSSFVITPQSDIIVNDVGDAKQIIWITDLAKGSTYNIGYEFDAPDISPEFYVLGPLEIGVFKEARQWQIANDQPPPVINTSIEGLLVYGEEGDARPRYRIWNGTTLSVELTMPITGPINWTVVKASNKKNEVIAVMVNSSGALLMT
ncbi:hypothetical protein HYU50_02895, partial [Candidatus Woesearchaeota archaeon]|nr:hypothetical protein [Candidatus Woesearchaeota archaeon]